MMDKVQKHNSFSNSICFLQNLERILMFHFVLNIAWRSRYETTSTTNLCHIFPATFRSHDSLYSNGQRRALFLQFFPVCRL